MLALPLKKNALQTHNQGKIYVHGHRITRTNIESNSSFDAYARTGEVIESQEIHVIGGIGVAAVIVISLVTWALLKAYAPVKTTVASTTQTPSTQQGTSSTTPVSTTAIVPVATTNAAVDNLQTLLQNDSSDDAATGTALNDNQQQVTVPTE